MNSPHKAYPYSDHCAIRIMPHHTSLGHSGTRLMVLEGPCLTTARGQSMGRHAVGPTTHPTIKKFPPPKKGYRCSPCRAIRIQLHHTLFNNSVKRLMVPGGGHWMTLRGQLKEGSGSGRHVASASSQKIGHRLPRWAIQAEPR